MLGFVRFPREIRERRLATLEVFPLLINFSVEDLITIELKNSLVHLWDRPKCLIEEIEDNRVFEL